MNVEKNHLENQIALKGMERVIPGVSAGLITLRLPYSTSIPISGHVKPWRVLLFFRRPIMAHLLRYDFLCLLAYDLYAALRKLSRSL